MIGVFAPSALGKWRRLEDIERLGERAAAKGDRHRFFAKMRDDESVTLWDYERDALLRRPVQLIPATPGASIIRVSGKAGDPWTVREPVIAWALCFDGVVRPVAPNGVPDDTRQSAYVEMPGGNVEGVGEWADPPGFENAAAMALHFAAAKAEALDA